jgi:hypothetical protein
MPAGRLPPGIAQPAVQVSFFEGTLKDEISP